MAEVLFKDDMAQELMNGILADEVEQELMNDMFEYEMYDDYI